MDAEILGSPRQEGLLSLMDHALESPVEAAGAAARTPPASGGLGAALGWGVLGCALLALLTGWDSAADWMRVTPGLAILLALIVRQALRVRDLEARVCHREQQLGVVGEVVSVLSGSPSVEHTLDAAVRRIRVGMETDAVVAWLPANDEDRGLTRMGECGLADDATSAMLLDTVQKAMVFAGSGACQHRFEPNGPTGRGAHCLSVRVGRRTDDLGYLTVLRWGSPFDVQDGAVLAAIGNDLAATLHHSQLVFDAERRADRDPLTGLFNHRYAYERLYQEAERQAEARTPVSVLMLDLDNFKLFNDTYGHPAGDALLRRTAGVLRRCFRDGDVVARYGGDEFIVILPGATLEQAVEVARRLQDRFADEYYHEGEGARVPVYVSCGVANAPVDAAGVLDLVAIADANLYEAKAEGRGKITARTLDVMDDRLLAVAGFDLLRSMVIAVDNKDRYTRRHSEEVTAYSLQIAAKLGLDEELCRAIHISGLLHDLGKIGIPDRILRKPGRLTAEETQVMNQHPEIGAMIVSSLPGMELIAGGVRSHHERYDGTGYPDRLAGEQIPLVARVLAVADVYSAMTTHRPYRKALTREEALAQIAKNIGSQFDPLVAGAFLELQRGDA